MSDNKHYIRVVNGIVNHGFSDAFEQPQAGDIQLSGEFGRHFQLNLYTDRAQFKYKIATGQMVERTQEELDIEWAARPAPPKTAEAIKQEQVDTNLLTLEGRTQGMQLIDDFTLGSLMTTDERTAGMQLIDDYSLELIFAQQATIEALTARITTLEGGV